MLLEGKLVEYSSSKDKISQGVVIGAILMKEAKDSGVVTGYSILLADGTITPIAYWRIIRVLSNGWKDIMQAALKNNSDLVASTVKPEQGYNKQQPNTSKDDLPF